jgi:hypothetical protein
LRRKEDTYDGQQPIAVVNRLAAVLLYTVE